jgi:hypothetical protein
MSFAFRRGNEEMRGVHGVMRCVHESGIGFQTCDESEGFKLKFQEFLFRKQRRFVTAREAVGVMRSGGG